VEHGLVFLDLHRAEALHPPEVMDSVHVPIQPERRAVL
jgi:hypothetical protein